MKAKGFAVSDITDITGLSEDEIEKLYIKIEYKISETIDDYGIKYSNR